MMKKLALSLLAIGCSLLTFISCSEEKDAFQLYSEMNQALEQVSSIQGSMDIDMKLTASKETLDLAMDMDITAVKRSETDADLAMKIESDMAQLGSFTMQAYTKDGYMYLDMLGMKIKSPYDPSADSDESQLPMADSYNRAVIDFTTEAVKESAIAKTDKGRELTFTLDGSKLTDALSGLVGNITESLGEGSNFSYNDVKYTVVVDQDNLPVSQNMTFSFDMEIEGERASADCDINSDFAYNKVENIEYPDDLDTYEELDLTGDEGLSI